MKWIKGYREHIKESLSQDELNRDLIIATSTGDLNMVRSMLDKGANVDARDDDKSTPLHLAVQDKNIEIIRFLLDKGASVDAEDDHKQTPLYLASSIYSSIDDTSSNLLEIIKLLMLHGADPVKGFSSMEWFKMIFSEDLSWYRGDLNDLEHRFKMKNVRKKLF